MSCKVNRSEQGLITEVVLENGQPSVLFNKINSNIFIPDSEVALNVYSNAYSEEFEGEEPQLMYRGSKGKLTDSLEDIFISNEDGKIEMGFSKDGEFTPIATLNTQQSKKSKFLSSQIKEGILSTEKLIDPDGKSYLKGKGTLSRTIEISSRIFEQNLEEQLQTTAKVREDGAISITEENKIITVNLKDGNVLAVSEEDFPEVIKRRDVKNKPELILQFENLTNRSFKPGAVKPVDKSAIHIKSLKTFLSSLGFSATSLEAYSKAYNNRHGKDPDVSALIDLANRVVAIAEGGNQMELMSEEVAHLAVETYNDQSSILGALTDIHLTPEYNEWAELYRQKYSEQFEGLALEEAVRKEILGKVIAKAIATQTQASPEAMNIWQRISDYFKSVFKSAHRRAIDKISAQISKDILANNLSAFSVDNLKGEGVFYSAGNGSTTVAINGAIKILDTLSRKVKGTDRVAISAKIQELDDTASTLVELEHINNIQDNIRTNLNIINSKLNSTDPNASLTSFDIGTFEAIQKDLMPKVGKFSTYVKENLPNMSPSERSIAEALAKDLASISETVTEMSSRIGEGVKEVFLKEIEQFLDENYELTPEDKAKIMSSVQNVQKDTSSIASNFGIMSYSASPLKAFVGELVQRMHVKASLELQRTLNPIINKIYDENLQNFQRDTILRDDNGNQTYYYENGRRIDEYDKDQAEEKLRIIKTLIPDVNEEAAKKAIKTSNVSAILQTPQQNQDYNNALQKWKQEFSEQRMLPEYYEQKEEMENLANVAPNSRLETGGIRGQIQEILSSARDKVTGKVNKSLLTPEQKIAVEKLQRALSTKRSPVDQTGNVYEGLRVAKWEELTQAEKDSVTYSSEKGFNDVLKGMKSASFTVLKDGSDLADLSPDARLALDMFNINTVMRIKASEEGRTFEREVSQDFIDELQQLENQGNTQDAYDFVMSNSTITFTDEYYESLDNEGQPTYMDDAQAEISAMKDSPRKEAKQAALESLKQLMVQKRELIKQYRKVGDSTEIAANDMTGAVRNAIIQIESEIATKRRTIAVKNLTERVNEAVSEKTISNTFNAMYRESREDFFNFAKSHMTQDNKDYVAAFDKYLRDNLLNGIDTEVDEKFEEFITTQQNEGTINENNSVEQTYKTLREGFAATRMASYAYSYKIPEFTQLLNEVKAGEVAMSSLLTNPENYPALKYAKINVDYEWSDASTQLNPNFSESYGREIPKFSKYKDEKFFAKYGISEQDYLNAKGDITQLTPTINQQAFEVLKQVVGANKVINENYSDNSNLYLRPQISRATYEKLKSSATTMNPKQLGMDVRDGLLDSISYLEDEKEYGETTLVGGQRIGGIKTPPKMYQNKLEDPSLLTEDVLFAMAKGIKESLLYKGRIENIDKVNLVIRHAKGSQFESKGLGKSGITKEGQASNVVKDLENYADAHLYGIKQTRQLEYNVMGRTVDLTKVMSTLQKMSSSFNLKYNPFVAATSLTTGLYNNMQNWIVGDDINSKSYKLAVSSLVEDMGRYLTDSTKVDRISRLNTRMEGFGLVDATGKLENAKDSFAERNALKLGHMMDRVANLPVVPRVLYTVLKDTRLSNGKFVNFNQFVVMQKNINGKITKSEINSLWDSLENNTFDMFLDDKEGQLKPNQRFFDQGFTQEIFDGFVLSIASKTKQLVQSVDGQLNESDRVMAQRDVVMNLLMQHKGWIPINASRIGRERHFNFSQGKFEEGHYRTAVKLLIEGVKRLKNPSSIKEYYNDLSVGDKKNLKRVLAHSTMMLMMIGVVLGLASGNDDDDSFVEDFARYIAYRSYGESASITPFGMYRALKDTAKQPFVVLSSYEKWTDIPMAVFASEPGSFVSALNKGTPLKRIEQLGDLDKTLSTWERFNDDNLALVNFFKD